MIEPSNGSASHEITHPKKRAMLAALARTGNISASARATDICRRTHYDWLESDPEYRPAVELAMEEAADVLEAVARQRALVGSDTLLIFLLKAVRPEKYRERYVPSGTVIEQLPEPPRSIEELNRRMQERLDGLSPPPKRWPRIRENRWEQFAPPLKRLRAAEVEERCHRNPPRTGGTVVRSGRRRSTV
jgi:hypothetical protein